MLMKTLKNISVSFVRRSNFDYDSRSFTARFRRDIRCEGGAPMSSAIRWLVLLCIAMAIGAPSVAIRAAQAPERKPQFALDWTPATRDFHRLICLSRGIGDKN